MQTSIASLSIFAAYLQALLSRAPRDWLPAELTLVATIFSGLNLHENRVECLLPGAVSPALPPFLVCFCSVLILTTLQGAPRTFCFSYSNLLRCLGHKKEAEASIDAHESHVLQRRIDMWETATTGFYSIQIIAATSAALFSLSIAADVRSGWCVGLYFFGVLTLLYELTFFIKVAYHTTIIGGKHTRHSRAVATACKRLAERIITAVLAGFAAAAELVQFQLRDAETAEQRARRERAAAAAAARVRDTVDEDEEFENTWHDRHGHADASATDARQSRWTRASRRLSTREKLFMFKPWSRARLQRRMGYLSGRFGEHAPHWQLYVWAKSALLLLFVVVIPSEGAGAHAGFACSVAAMVSLLVAQVRVRPFQRRYQNLLESWCLLAEIILMSMTYAYEQFGVASDTVIGVFLATSLAVPVVILGADLAIERYRRRHEGTEASSDSAAAAAAAEVARAAAAAKRKRMSLFARGSLFRKASLFPVARNKTAEEAEVELQLEALDVAGAAETCGLGVGERKVLWNVQAMGMSALGLDLADEEDGDRIDVVIASLTAGGAADESGLFAVGDVVLNVDGVECGGNSGQNQSYASAARYAMMRCLVRRKGVLQVTLRFEGVLESTPGEAAILASLAGIATDELAPAARPTFTIPITRATMEERTLAFERETAAQRETAAERATVTGEAWETAGDPGETLSEASLPMAEPSQAERTTSVLATAEFDFDLYMTSDGLVRLGRISGSDALANCGMLHRGDALLWARRPGEPLVKFGIDLAAARKMLLREGAFELNVIADSLEELGLHRRPTEGDGPNAADWWLRRIAVISPYAGANLGLHLARPCGTRALRVTAVEEGKPAAKAGLRVGDVLKSVEDRHLHGDVIQAAERLAHARGGVFPIEIHTPSLPYGLNGTAVRLSRDFTASARHVSSSQQKAAKLRRSSLPAFVLDSFMAKKQPEEPEEAPLSIAEQRSLQRAQRRAQRETAASSVEPDDSLERGTMTRFAEMSMLHAEQSGTNPRFTEAFDGRRAMKRTGPGGTRKKKERRKRSSTFEMVKEWEEMNEQRRPGYSGTKEGPGRETYARSKSQNVSFLEMLRGLQAAGAAEQAAKSSTVHSRWQAALAHARLQAAAAEVEPPPPAAAATAPRAGVCRSPAAAARASMRRSCRAPLNLTADDVIRAQALPAPGAARDRRPSAVVQYV